MDPIRSLIVSLGNRKVGTLALTSERQTAFQYSKDWLSDGFPISPFSLPLKDDVFYPKNDYFEGTFGVFDDSLPDGWGRLLTDRKLIRSGIDPGTITILHRLALTGENGKGSLEYWPVIEMKGEPAFLNFDEIAAECRELLESRNAANLDELYHLGGSSGGARPKITIKENDEEWIVKFPSSHFDQTDAVLNEYRCILCAGRCGIEIPPVKLFPSGCCSGYFGSKRFDRIKENGMVNRVHMVSAAGMLEVSYRHPSLDYISLMQLTMYLTKDFHELEKMYRLMCFNVFAGNQDDHAKNFSYLYKNGEWRLSPAYDLTVSSSYYGEHTTAVNGNGKPGIDDLYTVAEKFKLAPDFYKPVTEMIRDFVNEDLGDLVNNIHRIRS